jgi:hypothetical protein
VSPARRRRDDKRAARKKGERDTKAEYARRKARAEAEGTTVYKKRRAQLEAKGFTTSQAGGHAPEGETSVREFRTARDWHIPFPGVTAAGPAMVNPDLTFYEAQVASDLNKLVRNLRAGRISPPEYERSARQIGAIAGIPVVTDAGVAVAVAQTASDDDLVFDSPRANGGRR